MNWFRNLRLRWKLLVAFGVLLGLMIAQSFLAYLTTANSIRTSQSVQRSYSIIDRAESVEIALLDMQRGYRGFLLTGNEQFLAPYEAGSQVYRAKLAELRAEASGNPAQVRNWTELQQRIAAWQREFVEPGIGRGREIDRTQTTLQSLTTLVNIDAGKQCFDELGVILDTPLGSSEVY